MEYEEDMSNSGDEKMNLKLRAKRCLLGLMYDNRNN